jgi:hypothetical protein
MKKLLLIKVLIVLSLFTFGIVSFQHPKIIINKTESNSILFENKQLKFESNLVEFKAPNRSVIKNYVVFTITNKTNKNIEVTYSKEAYYNGKCTSCGTSEVDFSLTLLKNEIKTGDCSNRKDKSLKSFHSFKSGESNSTLTDLRITNVQILKL